MQIRPSSIARIVACPGALRMSAGAPQWMDDYGDSTVREEGTACHWVAHEKTLGRHPAIGTLAPNGVAVTEDMHIAADIYLHATRSVGCHTLRYEMPISIPSISANCAGTPDAAGVGISARGRPLVFVGDLKYGFRIVDVWPNYQLLTYATGIADLQGWRIEDCDIQLTIAQPRKWHRQGYVRTVLKTGEEAAEQVQIIRNAVSVAEGQNPPLQPGEHCGFCPGRARCSAADRSVHAFSFDTANDLTPIQAEDELAYLLEREVLLKARITGLSAQVDHAARTGQQLRKFERVRTTGKLMWRPDDIPKVRALGKLMGVAIENEPELVTPTQAKKLLPPMVVDSYAHRSPGAFKLERQDPSRWVEFFKGK